MYKIFKILIAVIAAVFILGVAYSVLIKKSDQTTDSRDRVMNFTERQKGVSLSPKSFETKDFTDFFAKAKEAGDIISWAGDWQELSREDGAPEVVAALARQYKYTPVIQIQFFSAKTGKLLRPLNSENKNKYRQSAVSFVKKFQPEYFGLGTEVNLLFEKSPRDFDTFADFFSEVSDEIKSVSPRTKVFTVFQLEKMKGLGGGLFGGKNDTTKNEWRLLEKFSKADLIAFTTYPGLIYKNPSDIPPDYFLDIKNQTAKPIAFTEIGWSSGSDILGFESSESQQAEFIKLFFEKTKELASELMIWSFLYDQSTDHPFNTMGLFSKEGREKLAWREWRSNE